VSRVSAHRRKHSRGFTLVELLIAVVIVLTISAIAVPNLMAAIDQARIARAVGDIHAIEDDVASYQAIYGVLPDALMEIYAIPGAIRTSI
jgi:prepilin-type N-terminal cleavage/methylation domain-containing protein